MRDCVTVGHCYVSPIGSGIDVGHVLMYLHVASMLLVYSSLVVTLLIMIVLMWPNPVRVAVY